MPNLGAPELIIIALVIAVPVGVWCMLVFKGKGRSPGLGFLLGFVLTLFLSLIGAVIALLIAYLSRSAPPASYAGAPVPPPPETASPDAQVIATFGPTTGWNGKRIVFDGGVIQVEGVGPVSAKGVLSYEKQGQIDWASQGMHDWVAEKAKYR